MFARCKIWHFATLPCSPSSYFPSFTADHSTMVFFFPPHQEQLISFRMAKWSHLQSLLLKAWPGKCLCLFPRLRLIPINTTILTTDLSWHKERSSSLQFFYVLLLSLPQSPFSTKTKKAKRPRMKTVGLFNDHLILQSICENLTSQVHLLLGWAW